MFNRTQYSGNSAEFLYRNGQVGDSLEVAASDLAQLNESSIIEFQREVHFLEGLASKNHVTVIDTKYANHNGQAFPIKIRFVKHI